MYEIKKLADIFFKESQRRRIVPKWQRDAPMEEPSNDQYYESESGFLGSFEDEEVFDQPIQQTQEQSVPQVESPHQAPVSNEKPRVKRKAPMTEEESLRRYWEDKKPEGAGYKPTFVGDFDPTSVETGKLSREDKAIREDVPEDVSKGDIYSDFAKKEIEREKERERIKNEKERESKELEEVGTEEQIKDRLDKINEEIKDKMNEVRAKLILPKLFGKTEIVRGRPQGPNANPDRPPSELVKAYKAVKEGGGEAKMVMVRFPKTPYTESFVSWVLADSDAQIGDIKDLLIEVHKLEANKKDIKYSKELAKQREIDKEHKDRANRFDRFFS